VTFFSVRRGIGVIGAAALMGALLSSCASSRSSASPVTVRPLRVATVQSAYSLWKVLADEASRRDRSLAFSYLPSTHSSGAVKAVSSDLADVAMVSRELLPEERNAGLAAEVVSDDGLTIATFPGTGVSGLTSKQLRDIYSGRVRNWRQVGGRDETITVLDRAEADAAKLIFRRFVLGPKLKITPAAVTLSSQSSMIDSVDGTPGSIGYLSLGDSLGLGDKIDRMAVDGVEPTVQNVMNGRYRMQRQMTLVYRRDAASRLAALLSLVRTKRASDLMMSIGYAPAEAR
jgi:phosphate transport system substrate-binding protein